MKEFYQLTGKKKSILTSEISNKNNFFRDKFFLNFAYSKDNFEKMKVKRFLDLYGKEILRKYRKSEPEEEKYKNAPTFREFIDYMLDLPLHRLDSHWLPTYFQCMPCHIKYSIIGR